MLDFNQHIDLVVGGAGSLSSLNTRLAIKRGSSVVIVPCASYPTLTGVGVFRTLQWNWRGRVEAGDVIFPGMVFGRDESLRLTSIDINSFVREVTLEQYIKKEQD